MEVLGDHAQNACLSGQGQGVGSGQIGIGCGHSQDEAVPLRAETEMGISPGKMSFVFFCFPDDILMGDLSRDA